MNLDARLTPMHQDGDLLTPGAQVARMEGSTRDLLTAERVVLNLLGRLSGVATQTRRFVDRLRGTRARLYDTRKTTPGWRRLEKYAVRCGGGHNHRLGLYDAVLIKDNHLAQQSHPVCSVPAAVERARTFLEQRQVTERLPLIEVEVDTLNQLQQALAASPDIILLDNMQVEQLREAVRLRDAAGSTTELEASGGVTLDSIRSIAETGVDRISVGAVTHSACGLDFGLDWGQDLSIR
jgi:nicotinate-nucleotide pyrophosphorylase (carboxylating)